MKKRVFSVILSLCFILTVLLGVPVYAAGGISLDKTVYTAGEKLKATVTGLSEEEIQNDVAIWYGAKGERLSNFSMGEYVANLPSSNIWEYNAPTDLGTYEMALLDINMNLISKVEFTVAAPKAKDGDIKISKTEVKINEPMSVTVKGLTNEMLENDAWLGIVEVNEKMENTILSAYISNLPSDNTYKFNAPSKFGKYEIRVFSDGTVNTSEYKSVLFGVVSFDVVSSKAKPGDIVLSKTNVQPSEKMTVTVNGLTKGEIDEDAFVAIEMVNEKMENTTLDAYISNFKIGNVYEFQAPTTPGNYEVRVICSGTINADLYSYALFGVAPFTVSGEPTGELAAGYEGLATWAATEVNKAVEEKLVTDKVLTEFPKEITREEFCELAILLYEKITGKEAPNVSINPFTDTQNSQVLKAFNLGIVSGIGEGKFAPNNKVTRQEISAMLVRTLKVTKPELNVRAEFKTKFRDENKIAKWALEAIRFMNSNEIIKGGLSSDGSANLNPMGNTTRQEAIAMVLRTFNTFNK